MLDELAGITVSVIDEGSDRPLRFEIRLLGKSYSFQPGRGRLAIFSQCDDFRGFQGDETWLIGLSRKIRNDENNPTICAFYFGQLP